MKVFKENPILKLSLIFLFCGIFLSGIVLEKPKKILHIDIYTENVYYAEEYSAKDLLMIQKTIRGYYKEEDMIHYDINGDGHVNEIDRNIIQEMLIKLYSTTSSFDNHFDIKIKSN